MTNRKKISFIIGLASLVSFILLVNHQMSRCGRNPVDFYPETELAKAVYKCKYTEAKKLIDQGANVNSEEGEDLTPLHIIVLKVNASHYAFNEDCINTIKLLIQSGVDLNAQDNYGRTPLHCSRDLESIRLLLEAHADPNIRDNNGETPLHHYISLDSEKNYTFEIELLLKHGARIDIKDNKGRSPLSIAQTGKYTRILQLFKKHEKIE